MAKHITWISMDRVISKFVRDTGVDDFSETDLVEYTGEVLEQIGTINLQEQAIQFATVKNYQVDLPCGLTSVQMIAKYLDSDTHATPNQQELENDDEEYDPNEFSCRTLLLPEESQYYTTSFDHMGEYYGFTQSNTFKTQYVPVRLSNNVFFDTLVLPEDQNLYRSSVDEYTISNNTLKFSFKEGIVAIAYNKVVVDKETGYPLIPDNVSVLAAINAYLMYKYAARLWFSGREGWADKMQYYETQYQWYCKQAGNAMLMPYGEDEFENMLQGRKQMIPQHKRYYGFFGNLNKDSTVGWSRGNTNPNRFIR